jgi:hypothetical protein
MQSMYFTNLLSFLLIECGQYDDSWHPQVSPPAHHQEAPPLIFGKGLLRHQNHRLVLSATSMVVFQVISKTAGNLEYKNRLTLQTLAAV